MGEVRAGCRGVAPLPGRLEGWQRELCFDADRLAGLVAEHGSPINLIHLDAMARNAAELADPAAERDVGFRIFFARKANKALAFVDRARELGLGVDVASERELRQVLDRGVLAADVIVTAAVKPRAMLELCADRGATVAIDNRDEFGLLRSIADGLGRELPIAVRLAPDLPGRPPTRFGLAHAEVLDLLDGAEGLDVTGVHFHLDGYDAGDRVAALFQSLSLVDALRARGHDPRFIDMGGGVPMSYLESERDWEAFWEGHEARTYDGQKVESSYPYWQKPTRGLWLAGILDASLGTETVADGLRSRGLELRCEPGRALLDGCGMTVARVEFRKHRADGTFLAGLAMNRTQMRSTSDDFMVDPLLVRPGEASDPTEPVEGYLVGAYCIERELISWRRFEFLKGVAVGDLIAFPNTAGYLMHILESASHQIPLAKNVVITADVAELDPIDA